MKAGIVGAGIMGRLIALSLSHNGWDVTIFDRDASANCSMAAGGLLTPITELEKNDALIFTLGNAALNTHWPIVLEQLDTPIYFQKRGSLVVSHPQDAADANRFITIISNKLNTNQYYQYLTQDQLIQHEPDAEKFNHAYYIENEGQIDNQAAMTALETTLRAKNITWHAHTTVLTIEPHIIQTKDTKYTFDCVFDCRGLDATDTFKSLRGVRGELIWFYAPDVAITRPLRLIHPRYSLYLAPRPNHIYLLGASEIESNDHSTISVRSTLELLTALYSVNSKFAEARIIKTVTQCRPTLPNNLPCIKYTEGLIAINGLYRHGFLIAPTLAHEVIKKLTHHHLSYPQLWEPHNDYCDI